MAHHSIISTVVVVVVVDDSHIQRIVLATGEKKIMNNVRQVIKSGNILLRTLFRRLYRKNIQAARILR